MLSRLRRARLFLFLAPLVAWLGFEVGGAATAVYGADVFAITASSAWRARRSP